MSNYIENEQGVYTSKEVQMYLKSEYELNLSSSSIIQHMKSNHNLSFKRVSFRPVFTDFDHIQRLKLLFAVEFSNLVDNTRILVNIDETSLSRTTKINYSWFLKGEN